MMATPMSARVLCDSVSYFSDLQPFLEDELYSQLKEHAEGIGPGSGRGRPVSLPSVVTVTNRLLLQLGLLRLELNKTWVWLETLSEKLVSQKFGKDLPNLENLIMKTSQKVPPVTSPSDVEEFLRKERDFTYPSSDSPFCVKFGIFRKSLLDCGKECGTSLPNISLVDIVPNGLIIELDKFKTENLLSGVAIFDWVQVMCPSLKNISAKELVNRISKMKVKYKKHLKAKARRPQEFLDFMEQDFASFSKLVERNCNEHPE